MHLMDERFVFAGLRGVGAAIAESRFAGTTTTTTTMSVTRAGGSNYAKEKVGSANGQVGVQCC